MFDDLIQEAQYKGYDSVFPGYKDFGHYWYQLDNMDYRELDQSMAPRHERQPIIKALYGLGCLTSANLLRRQRMVGGKVGILEVTEHRMTSTLKNHL